VFRLVFGRRAVSDHGDPVSLEYRTLSPPEPVDLTTVKRQAERVLHTQSKPLLPPALSPR
jgi:hypothetical protein